MFALACFCTKMVDPVVPLILTRRAGIHTLGQTYDPGYGITLHMQSHAAKGLPCRDRRQHSSDRLYETFADFEE
jgi:hypothetical protein